MKSSTLIRLRALIRKETRQMLRDRSTLYVGLLLPVVLLLLFGYGLSFDVTDARLTVVLEDNSPTAREAVIGLEASPWITPTWASDIHQAEQLLLRGETDAILRIPQDFSRQRALGQARVQLLLNGVDSSSAATLEGYVTGALATPDLRQLDRLGNKPSGVGAAVLVQRTWFNEPVESTWFIVPGLVVLIMTLIGAFLTSMLIAREWERGTLESLFVTTVRPLEIVLSKLAPYILIGIVDLALCLLAAKFLFKVPMQGSLTIIIATSLLYMLVSLALGLFISGVTRNQFAASQMALLVSFMPATMLSGFIFDLRNVPLIIRWISEVLPATRFMSLIKTLFMAGNIWPEIIKNSSILALYLLVLIAACRFTLRKRLP